MNNLELHIRENYPKFKNSKEIFITCPHCKTKVSLKNIRIENFGLSEVYICATCDFIIATCNKHYMKDKAGTSFCEKDLKILKNLGFKIKEKNDDKK